MVTYNVIFNEETDKGVYAISVVENPAMQSNFIALSEQTKIKLAEVDDKKFLLAGVVLVPERDVYRNQDGKEFNIRFSKDTIEGVANNFLKQGYQNNSSVEHETKIEGVSIVQSWVVKDPEQDTANAYGLPKEDIKEGSWIVLYKCDNKDIYNKALSGEIKGFSIDGLFSLEKVNLKSEFKMKEEFEKLKNDLLGVFKTALSSEKPTEEVEVKLGMATLKDGETQIEYDGEEPEVGKDVFVVNGEERVALPVGEYETNEGLIVVVAEEGKIAEVKQAEVVEEVSEELSSEGGIDAEFEQLMKLLAIDFAEQTKEQFDALKVELSEVKTELEEYKKQPAAVALKSAPSTKKYSELTEYEKRQLNK